MKAKIFLFICASMFVESSQALVSELDNKLSSAALILSDGAFAGDVVAEYWPSDQQGLVNGRVVIDGKNKYELPFQYLPRQYVEQLHDGQGVAFYYETPLGGRILQKYPRPAVYVGLVTESEYAAKKNALVARARSFLSKVRCSETMSRLLSDLDGERYQSAINTLFSISLLPADVGCLAADIASKKDLALASFEAPFLTGEVVYHPPFQTRGDLVAFLLPHLLKTNISPYTYPLSEKDRSALRYAWANWAIEMSAD